MNILYKRSIIAIILGFLAYHSVYFTKLSEHQNLIAGKVNFDSKSKEILDQISSSSYPKVADLQADILKDIDKAFSKNGNRLGIGSSLYFMVEIEGNIEEISNQTLKINAEDGQIYTIDLVFIFGNAIRDASKLVKLTDYKKTSDFNSLSEAINGLVRERIQLKNFKRGDAVKVKAACKINKQNTDLAKLKFIPVTIQK